MIERAHQGLLDGVNAALELLQDPATCALRASDVSGWSVQEHLEHLLLADEGIVAWVKNVAAGSARSDGPPRPTWRGYFVIWLGTLPRGKGRAPDFTKPTGAQRPELQGRYASVRDDVEELRAALPSLARDKRILKHPVLGGFTARRWLRFADIHHRHHGRIVHDIRAAARP